MFRGRLGCNWHDSQTVLPSLRFNRKVEFIIRNSAVRSLGPFCFTNVAIAGITLLAFAVKPASARPKSRASGARKGGQAMAEAIATKADAGVRQVYADLLSQAITGELVGMRNYATLVGLLPDVGSQIAVMHHASAELRHAENFGSVARACGLEPIVNPDARHWRRVRDAFVRYAEQGDLTACLVIQEIMLEAMAVALYSELGALPDERIARIFAATAREEAGHVSDGLDHLSRAAQRDPAGFADKVEAIHSEVMFAIADMLAGEEGPSDHCGLCAGSCVKQALPTVGLDRSRLRGRAMRQYLEALDALGVPGERSLAWVARLPI